MGVTAQDCEGDRSSQIETTCSIAHFSIPKMLLTDSEEHQIHQIHDDSTASAHRALHASHIAEDTYLWLVDVNTSSVGASESFLLSVPDEANSVFTASPACHSNRRVYAANYGYVGGCFGYANPIHYQTIAGICRCVTEQEIMSEIYHHGPVVVAAHVNLLLGRPRLDSPMQPPSSLLLYRPEFGVFKETSSDHMRSCSAFDAKVCHV